jgi:hypothetical protein
MEPQKLAHIKFIFPRPENPPEHTPESPTPATSHINLPELPHTVETPNPATDTRENEDIKFVDDEHPLSRFSRLLQQSKDLITIYGPYTTYSGTTIFTRAPLIRDSSEDLSTKDFATSVAAAQDCIYSAQVDGPAREDLATFERLSETTIQVLEMLLNTDDIDYIIMGWGVYGLSAGYMGQASREDSPFLSYKSRLHDALQKMPTMTSTSRKEIDNVASCGGKPQVLAKANREIHICANLMIQQFRREEWTRIRWYHMIAVAQRWLDHLGLKAGEASIKDKATEIEMRMDET